MIAQERAKGQTNKDALLCFNLFPFKIQGAIMVSSLFQIVIGFTGLVGFLLRFIGPLTIAPTITLVGVALFRVAAGNAGNNCCFFFRV